MQPDRNDPLVGTMLGKDYRVLEPIGAGGMAVVYLVEHQTLLKQFAAKVLSPGLAHSLEARARFAQEAHAASQLDHENIVSISDFGVTNDQRPFFVMELLRGKTLDARLAEGPMSLEEVVAVAVPVARALAYSHAEGVVHLDIKPENIFLVQRSQGRWGVKVVDFGIAKTPLNPRMTKVGETAGSPLFMAPEVCVGADDVDLRADVYSFGIVLYLMLCGRLPFVDDNVARILQMQLVELPAPPREVNNELSPELAAIIERCLAKDPRDRYPLMAVLLRDFQAALPPDADRLLIEQQSGASLEETAFPRTMSLNSLGSLNPLGMFDSQPQLISQPSQVMHAVYPAQPSGLHASQPSPIPGRRRALIVLTAALVTVALALGGALAYKEMNLAKARRDGRATSLVAANGTAPVAAAPAATPPTPPAEPAAAAAAPPAAEPAAAAAPTPDQAAPPATTADEAAADPTVAESDDDLPPLPANRPGAAASPSERAKLSRTAAISPKGPLHPKPTVRRDPPVHPGKRVATTTGAPGQTPGATSRPGQPIAALAVETPAAPAEPAPVAAAEPAAAAPPPRAEPAVAPPPPVQPAALPPPAPPVTPVTAAKPAGPGALDAVPAVTSLDVKGSLSPAIVRRGVERSLSALRNCYRTAAKAGGSTPSVDMQLSFEIDENGLATRVSTGGTAFGSLAGCAASVASQIRTQEAPDVGTVQVSVGIRFRPS